MIAPTSSTASSFMALSGRDKANFIGAAFLALFVWSITPISWAYLLHDVFLRTSPRSPFASVIFYYSLCEAPFSIYLASLRRKAQAVPPPPDVSVEALETLLTRCLGDHSNPATRTKETEKERRDLFRTRARRWFHHAPLDDIYADNAREWLAWAFGGRELEAVRADDSRLGKERVDLIERGLVLLQDRLGHTFKPGSNPNTPAMRLTLDPVRTLQRPFGYYVVCNGVSQAAIAWLRYVHGFKKERHGLCDFLVLLPSDPKPEVESTGGPRLRSMSSTSFGTQPIVFVFGLGVGLGQYIVFLRRLVHHQGGIVILLQPHISVDIWHPRYLNAPTKEEHVEAFRRCLAAHNFKKATCLSHSNGSYVHSWLVRDAPDLAHRHILVDPVCFLLWEGATSYAFLAKRWQSGIEILLGYFVAREVGIAYTIARRFLWWDMLFWIDDVNTASTDRVQVVMGGNDVLLDVSAVQDYLAAAGIGDDHVTVIPGAQHGQALFMPSKGMDVVCRHLRLPTRPS